MNKLVRNSLSLVVFIGLIAVAFVLIDGSSKNLIRRTANGDYEYKYLDKLSFTNKNTKLPSVVMKGVDSSIEFSYQPNVKEGQSFQYKTETKGNQIIYKDVEPNTNLIYTVLDDGKTIKEDIELTKKPEIVESETLSYTFEIKLNGLTYTKQSDGSIAPEFKAPDGSTYSIPELVMTDAKGSESRDLNMYIFQKDAKDTNILTGILTPSNEWLNAEDREYPIKIDPTVTWAQANWWDDAWAYRQSIIVTNSNGSNLTDFQVSFTIDTATLITAGKMQVSCADIRVTDISGSVLHHWVEENSGVCNSATTRVWFKAPSVFTTGTTFFIYYGNSSATNVANGSNVFDSFEDFSGTTISESFQYGGGGTFTQNEYLSIVNNADAWDAYINPVTNVTRSKAFYTRVKADTNARIMVGWHDSGSGTSYTDLVYAIYFSNGTFYAYEDGNNRGSVGSYTVDTWYDLRIDIKATGAVYYYKATGAASWTTLYTSVYSTEDTLRPAAVHYDVTEYSHLDDWFTTQYISTDLSAATSTEEKSPAPVAYWKFDEGQGVVASNSTWQKLGTVINYVTNPSFETSATTNWNIYQSPTTAQSTDAVFGIYSHSMTTGASINPYIYKTDAPITLAAGQTWTFSAYVKAGNTGGVGNTVTLNLRENGDNSYLSTTTKTLTAEWQRFAVSRTLTHATPTTLDRWIRITSSAGSGDVLLIDGVQLEQLLFSTNYCDGSIGGYGSHVWNGTTQLSSSTCDYGTDGAIMNTPKWQTEDMCISGKCLKFDGVDDYTLVSHNASNNFSGTAPFTLQAWVKPNSIGTGMVIISKFNGSVAGQYQLALNTNGTIGFHREVSPYAVSGSTVLQANKWYFVSGVYDGTNIRVFVNGLPDSSTQASGSIASDTNNVLIGASYTSSSPSTFFKGFIDEPKIYSYARSTDEIKSDYNSRGAPKGTNAQFAYPVLKSGLNLAQGLVGYWKMDEAAANICTGGVNDSCDSSGNVNDGVWNGNTTTITGKFGNGTAYDGNGDYINMGSSTALNPDNISISAWVNPNAGYSSVYRMIVTRGIGDMPNTNRDWQLRTDITTGYPRVLFYDTAGASVTAVGTGVLPAGTWSHVVGIYDGNKAYLYVNGDLVGTADGVISRNNSGGNVEIGRQSNTNNYYFLGNLDEARIYNRALSEAEVRALYNFAPGPVAYWDLNENTGTTSVYDKSGNGNTGTMGGTMTASDWVPGKLGSALDFDGSDDRVSVADNSSLDITGSLTVSAWVSVGSLPAGHTKLVGKSNEMGNQRSYTLALWGNQPDFFVDSNGQGVTYCDALNTAGLSANRWYHLTGVYNGSTCKVYIDGVETKSVNYSSGTYSGSASLVIGGSGGEPFGGLNNYIGGKIDEVKIYNYARTPAQIIEDMNAGHPAPGSPVGSALGHWKFDEGYGTTANNNGSGGSTYNGTLSGMASPATSTSGWTNDGKFGKAVMVDGSDDYIDIGTPLGSTSGGDKSISVWVYPTAASTGYIVSNYHATSDGFSLIFNADRTLGIAWTQTINAVQTTSTLPLNTWSHILAIYTSGTTGGKIYINGNLSKEGNLGTEVTATNKIKISSRWVTTNTGTAVPFTGGIDEVKIYNLALTADQVKAEYNAGKSQMLGSLSTGVGGTTPSWSAAREYCVPGDTSTCSAPVAEWKMDENTGTTSTFDTSGNGLTATWNRTDTNNHWYPGVVGSGLQFTSPGVGGSDLYLTVANSALLSPEAGNQTISAWVYPTNVSGTAQYVYDDYGSATNNLVQIILNTTNKFRVYYRDASNDFASVESLATISANRWYYLTAVRSGTTVYLYQDGVLQGSSTAAGLGTITTSDGVAPAIGRYSAGASSYFYGNMDQFRVYNYARTPAQIAWEYNQGAPVAWYRLDECQGTTAYNAALNGNGDPAGNNGTITIGATGTNTSAGTCAGSAGQAWFDGATGKIGSSLEFDGTDDYVNINSLYGAQQNISVSAWINLSTSDSGGAEIINISNYVYLRYSTGSGGSINAGYYNGTNWSNYSEVVTDLEDSQWHHVIFTIDASQPVMNYQKIYIDGKVRDSDHHSANITYTGLGTATDIGRHPTNGTFDFGGQIDDVRIFNYALTDTQAKDVYNNGAVSFR